MGIGYVLIIPKKELPRAEKILQANRQQFSVIGVIRKGVGVVTYKD
jgi:phosphoribosylaminoimidazole (AIR) synthetase